MQNVCRFFRCFHCGNFASEKEKCRNKRNQREQKRQQLPIFAAEQKQKDRADNDHENNAPCINGMELAHFSVGIICRDGGDHGADQNLAKSAGGRKDHRADDKSDIYVIGHEKGPDRIDEKAENSDQRDGFDRFCNIEFM